MDEMTKEALKNAAKVLQVCYGVIEGDFRFDIFKAKNACLAAIAAQPAAPVGSFCSRCGGQDPECYICARFQTAAAPPPGSPQEREAVIEECARAAEGTAPIAPGSFFAARRDQCEKAALAIRALSVKPVRDACCETGVLPTGGHPASDPLYDSRNPNHGRSGGLRDPESTDDHSGGADVG